MKRVLFLVFFCSKAFLGTAQERVLLAGILRDQTTAKPVSSVHVLNLTDSLATISSTDGIFKVPVHLGDSIVFTCIGYHPKALIVGSKEMDAGIVELTMSPRAYQLAEVE
ncbi:MAG: hypothetical protein EP314_07260, partial [Bacteroidetes bacterium]